MSSLPRTSQLQFQTPRRETPHSSRVWACAARGTCVILPPLARQTLTLYLPLGLFFRSLRSSARCLQSRSGQKIQPRGMWCLPPTDEGWGWGQWKIKQRVSSTPSITRSFILTEPYRVGRLDWHGRPRRRRFLPRARHLIYDAYFPPWSISHATTARPKRR